MQDITVALASKSFVNGDIGVNLTAVLAAMAEGAALGADLVCFGEAFLQGFDSLCWDYGTDRAMALTRDDAPIRRFREASRSLGVDVMFGFIEREGRRCTPPACWWSGARLPDATAACPGDGRAPWPCAGICGTTCRIASAWGRTSSSGRCTAATRRRHGEAAHGRSTPPGAGMTRR